MKTGTLLSGIGSRLVLLAAVSGCSAYVGDEAGEDGAVSEAADEAAAAIGNGQCWTGAANRSVLWPFAKFTTSTNYGSASCVDGYIVDVFGWKLPPAGSGNEHGTILVADSVVETSKAACEASYVSVSNYYKNAAGNWSFGVTQTDHGNWIALPFTGFCVRAVVALKPGTTTFRLAVQAKGGTTSRRAMTVEGSNPN